jgi:hypothetical protein
MKTTFTALVALLSTLVVTGCNRSIADTHDHAAEPTPAATYKAGHGLQLSPTATQMVGLETGEVGTRDVGSARSVAAIPASALLRTVKGDFVFVVNGEWFLRTPVTLAASAGEYFEVKDGLYEGDRIVTRGAPALWLAELQAVNGGVGCADHH